MQSLIIRVIGYAILFLICMIFLNMDHATPGSDEPLVKVPFWALFTMAYATGFTLALAGSFEKLFAEQINSPLPPKSWFIIPSLLLFLLGLKLEYDSGFMQLENWYDYFYFIIYGLLILSNYLDLFSEKK